MLSYSKIALFYKNSLKCWKTDFLPQISIYFERTSNCLSTFQCFLKKKYFPALNTETTNVKCPSFSKSLIKQLKFLSSDNVGLRPVTLWKKRFWHSYYPENFAESKEHIHSILKERTSLQEMLISVRTRQSHSFISH